METSQTLRLLGCVRERRKDTCIRSNPEDLKDVPPDATTAACTVKKEINQDNSHSVSTVGNNIYQGDNSLNPCGSARSSPARNVNESSSCETLDLITDCVYNNREEEQCAYTHAIHSYTCSYCGQCYRYKSQFLRHERIHTGEKPYTCTTCEKSFAHGPSFVIHQRIHTGEKPYTCSECGKRFYTSSCLTKHHKVHTGERPYACTECDRTFICSSRLLAHQITHTGEKTFRCSDCGKSFLRSYCLDRHRRIHTGEKPYACSECGKRFISSVKLRSHQRVHTKDNRV